MLKQKGSAVKTLLKVLEEMGGRELMQAVQKNLPEEHRMEIFGRKYLPVSWVRYDSYVAVFRASADYAKEEYLAHFQKINNRISEYEFKGAMGIFVRVLSPQTVIKNMNLIWRQYNDQGKIEMFEKSEKKCKFRLMEIDELPKYHELEMMTSFIAILSKCKCQNIKIQHTACLSQGAEGCVFEAQWE